MRTIIVVLDSAYMEYACNELYLPEVQRRWHYVRTVDYRAICIQ